MLKNETRTAGLSPRVRGHLCWRYTERGLTGTIPAGAGTPAPTAPTGALIRDYPRGCGDTRERGGSRSNGEGLSPRVRGHLDRAWRCRSDVGTIPAGAGTPGTIYGQHISANGLSPRVRGHRPAAPQNARAPGTIPAGAGTPPPPARRDSRLRDYPRGCGDTPDQAIAQSSGWGLSPRVRGHHGVAAHLVDDRGTIPAGAGTPF